MIEKGDKVKVNWYDDREGSTQITGIVEHAPNDVGDMWHLKCVVMGKEQLWAINPSCSTLESIVKTIGETDEKT